MMAQREGGFYVESTTFGGGVSGGRIRVGGPDGAVEGVFNEVSQGSLYAIALRRSKVKSLSARKGWRWSEETFAGVHEDAAAAAAAIHSVYGGGRGPHEV